MVAKKIAINGIVQGVGFRPFVYREATANNLNGTVKNMGDAGVEIVVEGANEDIENFLMNLKINKPPLAKIEGFDVERYNTNYTYKDFKILRSQSGGRGAGTIPPDTATCDECLKDMRSDSRYQNYWATSCVNCGPRFTVIEKLPYDRVRTSMKAFPLCKECKKEYIDPSDRRYHAQTIACQNCGPGLSFDDDFSDDPIQKAACSLIHGEILAIKGIGGTHIACNGTEEEIVSALRSKLERPGQPFALMATEKMLQKIARVNRKEQKLLKSLRRPIVILDKKKNSPIASSVSPGLHNVGIMLPYSGLHHLIFEKIDFPLVMTSANLPGEPMLIENLEIKRRLKGIVDHYLLHNRKIVSRCDDSVVRWSGGNRRFLRKSRGWAPAHVDIELDSRPILALGAELDNTISLYADGKCYTSQYIGDIDDVKTYNYLNQAIEHLLKITGQSMPDHLACDLHPQFLTTRLAKELGKEVTQVQHHHAHAAKILGEHQLEETIALTLDGAGYGTDGHIWGGEVLAATRSNFQKLGGLSNVYMPGGDLATKYPVRMIAGILYAGGMSEDKLYQTLKSQVQPAGKVKMHELECIITQLKSGINVHQTSSTGRFLDAVSALLGICYVRTYEGEPAMKLESAAVGALPLNLPLEFETREGKKFLNTPALFQQIMDLKNSYSISRVAATAQYTLAKGLVQIAREGAKEQGINNISLSGGVTYNDMITHTVKEETEQHAITFYTNIRLPCGDGGISYGQVIVAGTNRRA